MRKMLRKTITLALSAMLAMQVFAVGASAELFIDNPVVKDGKTSVKVANYTNTAQKVRLYTASYEGEALNDVDASEIVEVAAGGSAELTTDITGTNYFWSDALVPYDEDAVALAVPTGMTAPASRDSASNHRTWAYNSFLLEWDLDETGVVDHYEVYADGTKIGETENGYYIVYVDDANEASKSYTVKAVTAGGKESDTSATVSAGSLYMNEIDFSNMEVATTETSFDVTYPYINNETFTIDQPKYGTNEDVKGTTATWIGAIEGENPANGVEAKGMSMYVGALGIGGEYAAPALIGADAEKNREAKGAYKTYYSYKSSNNHDAGIGTYMYFSLDDDLLTVDNVIQPKVTFEYDYFDNGNQKIYGRFRLQGGSTGYVGGDPTRENSETWKTTTNAVTNYNNSEPWNIGGEAAHSRIFSNISSVSGTSSPKLYISAARAWLTDRMRSADWTEAEKRQNVSGTFAGVEDVIADGLSVTTFSSSQRRSTSDLATNFTAGAYMTVGKGTSANIIAFNVDDTYLSKYDKNVTIEFDYYINMKSTETFDVVVSYTDKEGTTKKHTQTFAGGRGTAKITLTDAGFNNLIYNCDFTVEPGINTQQLYILNMDVHASNNVK